MITHLTEDELLALIDSGADSEHLSTCARCRQLSNEIEATLALARRVPQVRWTPLQGEALLHGVRRRLRDRREQPRPAWRSALGGAVVSGALAAILVLLLLPMDPANTTARVVTDNVAEQRRDVEDLDDTELATMIEAYLIETASADELLLELDELSDDEYYVLLSE